MRETITALRGRLEDAAALELATSQEIRADREQDRREARDAVQALRDELERLRFEQDDAVARASEASADELSHLRGTIQTLRGELERLATDHADELESRDRAFRDERAQLTSMITALRDQLEEHRGRTA
jgi:phage host-nuclease inhibitor protein Gam